MRLQGGIGQAELCAGLCTVSMLSRIENGERDAGKLLRDRLLERAGIDKRCFEEYLQPDEYCGWKARQEIVWLLLNGQSDAAMEQIIVYESLHSDNDLEKQFCYVMRAMALSSRGDDVCSYYKKAIDLSMAHIIDSDTDILKKSLLSTQELNILLEYQKRILVSHIGDMYFFEALSFFDELLSKVIDSERDRGETVKIYPKAVIYYCEIISCAGLENEYKQELIFRCKKAVELLREQERTYYLSELTDWLAHLAADDPYTEKCIVWRNAFESLYAQYSVRLQVICDAWLYIENGANNIGDVIFRRRKMYGMTQSELCDGICSEKTLNRIENAKSSISAFIMKALFERLYLTPDYVHGEVLTINRETIRSLRKLNWYGNNLENNEFYRLLVSIRNSLPMDCVINKQFWIRYWNNHLLKEKKITNERYIQNHILCLEMSRINELNLDFNDYYITASENLILYDLLLHGEYQDFSRLFEYFKKMTESLDSISFISHYYLYGFLMNFIASRLGNEEDYEESSSISRKIIKTGILIREIYYLSSAQYDIIWNTRKEYGVGHEQEKNRMLLSNSCYIAEFCNKKLLFNFLQDTYHSLYEG